MAADGALRVITSADGKVWESAALLTSTNGDLRDAKITETPDHRLMLSGAIAYPKGSEFSHQSLAWFSGDGTNWSEATKIGEPNYWLWRTTWHAGRAFSVGYETSGKKVTRLYSSGDGRNFETLMPIFFEGGWPNEASLLFLHDGRALCLLRQDGTPGYGQIGLARAPYEKWDWKDSGVKIGGPALIQLPDGRVVAAVRLYDGKVRTSLAWLDPEAGKLTEFLKLPSGGDCSYAGLVWHEGLLWMSYYSSHEGKTSIYLAKVRFNKAPN